MATTAHPRVALAEGTRFYTAMAFAMSAIIVAGFSANIVMGRSSFSLPLSFHVHGLVFVGWIGLFLAQHVTIATGRFALHARLGQLGLADEALTRLLQRWAGYTVAEFRSAYWGRDTEHAESFARALALAGLPNG